MPNRPSTSGRQQQQQAICADAALSDSSPRQRRSSKFDTSSNCCNGNSSCHQQQPKQGTPHQKGHHALQASADYSSHRSNTSIAKPASPGQGQCSSTRRDCYGQASSAKHVTPRNSMSGLASAPRPQQHPSQEASLLHCQNRVMVASASRPQSATSQQPHTSYLKALRTVNPLYINRSSTASLPAASGTCAPADPAALAAATAHTVAAAAEATLAEAEQQNPPTPNNLSAAAAATYQWQVGQVQPGSSGQLQEHWGRGLQLAAGVLTQDPAHPPGSCKAAATYPSSSSTKRSGSRWTRQSTGPGSSSRPGSTSRPSTATARPFQSAAGSMQASALGYAGFMMPRLQVSSSPSAPGQAPGSPRRPRSSIPVQQQQPNSQQHCMASGPLLSDYFRPPSAAAPGSIRLSGLPGSLPLGARASSAPSLKFTIAKSSWDASLTGISSKARGPTTMELSPCSCAGRSDDGAAGPPPAAGDVQIKVPQPGLPASNMHPADSADQQQQQQQQQQQLDIEMLEARQRQLGPDQSTQPAQQQLLLWSAAHEIDGRPATRTGDRGMSDGYTHATPY